MSNSPYSGSAVKRSAGYFLIGKAASALLTFAILLWLVRLLTIPEYAAYITLVATLDIAVNVTNLGLPWIEARYLPEFRLHASKARLIRFITQLIQCHIAILLSVAVLAWLSLDWWLLKLEMLPFLDAAKIYILTLIVDSTGSHLRVNILGALLQQKLAQVSLVTRNLVFLIGLGVLVYTGEVNLTHVVAAQLIASVISVLISLVGLWRYLKYIDVTEKSDWIAPKWSQMWAVAKNMYLSGLVGQVYSTQVFTLIIRYNLGAETTAIFGFLRNLFMQTMNYLPASLLFGLIRPKLVASYVGDGGIVELTRNANIVGKVSLFVLMPLLVFTWLTSEELVAQFSGDKFPHSGYYLAGLFCALVPFSQRQILETVTVVTSNSYLCNYAALVGIFTVPVAYGLMQIGFGLWAPIIAVILGHLIFCSTIAKGLTKKTLYKADLSGYYKMLLAAFLGYLSCDLVLISGQGWIWIVAVAILASCAFLLAAAIIKPFSDDERLRINKLIKRNVFIW